MVSIFILKKDKVGDIMADYKTKVGIEVHCELKTNSPGEEVIEQWSGSCIAIGKNLVATNYHVVDNATQISKTMNLPVIATSVNEKLKNELSGKISNLYSMNLQNSLINKEC